MTWYNIYCTDADVSNVCFSTRIPSCCPNFLELGFKLSQSNISVAGEEVVVTFYMVDESDNSKYDG